MLILSSTIIFYHLHSFSALHLDILTSSHPHILHLHICSSSHLIIFTSSHPHSFTSSPPHLFTSSYMHIFSSSHHLIFRSSLFPSYCPALLLSCRLGPGNSALRGVRGAGCGCGIRACPHGDFHHGRHCILHSSLLHYETTAFFCKFYNMSIYEYSRCIYI